MKDSKDLNEDELLSMMEEMQDQIEGLQINLETESQKNSEAQKEISKISSENSLLRKTLQQKSEMIVSLNEKIGNLSESDLILKKNEELIKQNKELLKKNETLETGMKNARRSAENAAEAAEEKYSKMANLLSDREYSVKIKEGEIRRREHSLNEEVRERVDEQSKLMIKKLRERQNEMDRRLYDHYRYMKWLYSGRMFLALFYGIMTTMIMLFKTKAFRSDVGVFVKTVATVFVKVWLLSTRIGGFVASLGDRIPNEILSGIVHWLLMIMVVGLLAGALGRICYLILRRYVRFFMKNQADEITGFVLLCDLAFVLFAADEIKSILSVNLVLLEIILFVIYSLIRWIIREYELKQNAENSMLMSKF